MKVLSTKFNLDPSVQRADFMGMALLQIAKSPACSLDLSGLEWQGKPTSIVANPMETERLAVHDYDEALVLSLVQSVDEDVFTTLTCVLRDRDEVHSLYVGLEKETRSMAMPSEDGFELPAVLRAVFWNEWGGEDGWLHVDDRPHLVRKGDVQHVVDSIKQSGSLSSPVVYVSVKEDGTCGVDAERLAKELAGQAHVLVEASPVAGMQMAAAAGRSDLRMPRDGGVSVFLPSGESCLMRMKDGADFDKEVCDTVRRMLLGVSFGKEYDVARMTHASLSSRLGDEELSQAFEELLNEKQGSIDHLKAENTELKRELSRMRAKVESLQEGLEKCEAQEGGKFITLTVTEDGLYDGEMRDVVLKALQQVRDGMGDDLKRVRKYQVLRDVLEHNFPCGTDARLIDCIRGAFEDGVLTEQGIGRLRDAGFLVEKDKSGHYKICPERDNRYTGIYGGTVSDKARASKNFISEFCNTLFGY